MTSILYIRFILRLVLLGAGLPLSVALAGCGEVPIARTNCWSSAGAGVAARNAGAPTDLVTRRARDLDVVPCR